MNLIEIKMSDIKEMLSAYNSDSENDAVYAYFEKDNIWKILDIQRYEPSHSAFLAWFFDQKLTNYPQVSKLICLLVSKAGEKISKDNWNKTPDMSDFCNAVLTSNFSIKTVSVTTEMVVNKISTLSKKDRIDIFISCAISLFDAKGEEQDKILEIIIENKVDGTEGDVKNISSPDQYDRLTQTERYFYACSKEYERRGNNVDYQLFVFLTSKEEDKCKCENFIHITYQNLVDNVFENFLKRTDIEQHSRDLIEAYLHNLGNPFNKTKKIIAMTNNEKDLLVRFYNRNEKLINATIDAMIENAKESGDTEKEGYFKAAQAALKDANKPRRYYTINGKPSNGGQGYAMWEVIREFVIYLLNTGESFNKIKDMIDGWTRCKDLISDNDSTNIKLGSNGRKPHSFEYNNQTYYVTDQLGDKDITNNFRNFRNKVNDNKDWDFQISPIDDNNA